MLKRMVTVQNSLYFFLLFSLVLQASNENEHISQKALDNMRKLIDSYKESLKAPVPKYIKKGEHFNKYKEWQSRYRKDPITEDSFGYIPKGKQQS